MVTGDGLRVAFFGTPAFAVPTLEALLASRHIVTGVVTQPDRPRGRGQKTSFGPVKSVALDAGLRLLQPAKLKDAAFLEALAALDAELGVVAAYGRILPEAVLDTPPLGMLNVHASLLPRYRGAAPVHRAVMAGDAETGVTIMRVVQALDAGPMLAARHRAIGAEETSEEVERDLAIVGADLLVATLDRVAAGGCPETPQDESAATYAPRITREDGIIDWRRSAGDIHNQVRGLYPWPHAYSYVGGQRIILLRSRAVAWNGDAMPGVVVEAQGDQLRVATGSGSLAVLLLQPEGKRPMTPRDFLAGHPLAAGARFQEA